MINFGNLRKLLYKSQWHYVELSALLSNVIKAALCWGCYFATNGSCFELSRDLWKQTIFRNSINWACLVGWSTEQGLSQKRQDCWWGRKDRSKLENNIRNNLSFSLRSSWTSFWEHPKCLKFCTCWPVKPKLLHV